MWGCNMLRIIDKKTKLFIRDDFYFDEETEIAIDVTPSKGLLRPRWDGTGWVEDMSAEEIIELQLAAEPTEPTMETLIEAIVNKVVIHDTKIVTLEETIDVLYGGV